MKPLTPAGIAPPFARYSHGMEVPPGARWVRTSGQLGMDPSGVVPPGAGRQAAICFGNIDAILSAAGMGRENVVHVQAYVTDRAHMAGYMAARDAWLRGAVALPTSTLLIVAGFTRPEFVVEIEVVAAA